MLLQLHILKKYQDVINKKDMFCIFITPEEKHALTIDLLNMHPKLELWLYKNLELNKREYLSILANRIGIKLSSKYSKYELVNVINRYIIFE